MLLTGEIAVHSPRDDSITALIRPTEEVVLSRLFEDGSRASSPKRPTAESSVSSSDPDKPTGVPRGYEEVVTLEHSGCFGESVLTGRRRQAVRPREATLQAAISSQLALRFSSQLCPSRILPCTPHLAHPPSPST